MTTVWQRLRDAGRTSASFPTFRRYAIDHIRAVDPARLTVLLPEPAFGEAMEIDYGRLGMWTDPIGGRRRTVWAFVATPRASGMHFVRPVLRMDRSSWIACHQEALAFFGGSARFWICDNLKTGVLKADLYDPRLNRAYRELAEHVGALIDPARALHPKDKPRVERAVPYVRDSFWSGRAFRSFEEIVREALVWSRDTAPRRRHRIHGLPVRELFEPYERPALIPLPERPFALVEWKDARVHPDCHVAIDRVLYSVPWQHVGKTLQAKVSASLVELFDGDTLVKTHVKDGRRRITDQADLPPDKVAFLMRTPAWCRRRAAEIGSATATLSDGLPQQGGLTRLREVQALLRLLDTYAAARLEAACALALTADGRMKTVRNILEAGLDQRQLELALPPTTPARSSTAPKPSSGRWRDEHAAAAAPAQAPQARRDAPDPRAAARPGAPREARAPRVPGADARGRDPAPREQGPCAAHPARALRGRAHALRVRLRLQPQDPLRADPRSCDRRLHRAQGVGPARRSGRRRQDACRPGHRPRRLPPGTLGAVRQDRARAQRPRRGSPRCDLGAASARYLAPDLLILDDFGLRAFTERQGEDLYELVSERVRRGSTIVTSNRPPQEWYALFPNPVLAEGALDRLINASHHVTLEGRSYRPRQRPDARGRAQAGSDRKIDENEAVRSTRTPATERPNIRTLGTKGVQTEKKN